MATLGIRRTEEQPDAILVFDGEDVDPDANVTMPARTLAECFYSYAVAGVKAGLAVPAVRKEAPSTWPRDPMPVRIVEMPARQTSRAVQRDAQGQIVGVEDLERDA